MAGHMRDWLSQTIEQEVNEAVQWCATRSKDASPPDQLRRRVGGDMPNVKVESSLVVQSSQAAQSKKYSNNGSNLRIVCAPQQGKFVQALEFIDSNPPYPAILSDGTTRIKAKFSGTVQERFQKLNNRPLSRDTKGGVFLIAAFEIVLSLQTVQDQITLLVKECQFSGAAGSAAFGNSKPIETNTAIKSLVEQLKILNQNEKADVDSPKASPEPPQSSSSGVACQVVEDQLISQVAHPTQTQFASQIVSTARDRPVPDLSIVGGINLQSPRGPRKATGLHYSTKATDILLSKLQKNKRPAVDPSTVTVPSGFGHNPSRATAPPISSSVEDCTTRDGISSLQPHGSEVLALPLAVSRGNDGLPATSSADNLRRNVNALVEDVTPVVPAMATGMRDSTIDSLQPLSFQLGPKLGIANESAVDKSILVTVESGRAEINPASLGASEDESKMGGHLTARGISEEGKVVEEKSIRVGQIWRHENNFRFVKHFDALDYAPPQQMNLLARPESWQHPLPGLIIPSPNIPVDLLHDLNQEVRHLANTKKDFARAKLNDHDQKDAGFVEAVDLPEDGQSSPASQISGWTPSSPPSMKSRVQPDLPPDSSAEEYSRNQIFETEITSYSLRKDFATPFVSPHTTKVVTGSNEEILPDDSSDLEMEVPHALPATPLQNRGRAGLSVHGTPTAPSASLSQKSHMHDFCVDSSPPLPGNTQKHTPRSPQTQRHNAHGLTKDGLFSDVIVSGTSKTNTEFHEDIVQSRHVSDGAPLRVPSTPDKSAIRHDFEAKSGVMIRPDYTQISMRASSSSMSGQDTTIQSMKLKRKLDATLAPEPSRVNPKKALRYNLGLDPASQNATNPAVAARDARHAFHKRDTQSTPSGQNVNQVSQTDAAHSHLVADIRKIAAANGNSPSSYQPQEKHLGAPLSHVLMPVAAETATAPKQPFRTLEISGVPVPEGPRRGSNTLSNSAPGSIIIAQAGVPLLSDNARKVSASSSLGKLSSQSAEQQLPDGNDVYQTFTKAYPSYTGKVKHFLGLCQKLYIDRTIHRSLWDDFIIRHRTDYSAYVAKCNEDGEEASAYEQFYNEQIEAPKYTLRIVNPATLAQALASNGQSTFVGTPHQAGQSSRHSSAHVAANVPPLSASAFSAADHRSQQNSVPDVAQSARSGDGSTNVNHYASYRPSLPSSTYFDASTTHSPTVDRFPRTQGSATYSGSGRPLPWEIESKQDNSAVVTSRVARSGHNTHSSKGRGQNIRTVIDKQSRQEVVIDTEVLDSIEYSTASESPPPAGQHSGYESMQKQSVQAPRGTDNLGPSQNAWWEEDDTPFKEFARNYARLKIHGGFLGNPGTNPVLDRVPAQLNVLDWDL